MSGKHRWLSVILAVAVTTLGVGPSAGADSGAEGGFLSAMNSSRSGAGLASLTMDSGLRSYARQHTQDMIAADDIFHSSSAALQNAAGSGWTTLAENVGRGGTVSSLHNAFMNSAGHKKNILGDYNYVGIGAATADDGRLYVTVVFMKKGNTAPPTTTTTAPPATTTSGANPNTTSGATTGTAPSITTTTAPTATTTLPPSTTTTLIVGPDKPVTPGQSCVAATHLWWMCHD